MHRALRSGFTLIEMIVAIVIVAIIVAATVIVGLYPAPLVGYTQDAILRLSVLR